VTTLGTLITNVSRDLRDSSNATWSTTEVQDLIVQGVDALAAFYPKEVIDTSLTVSASAFTYTLPTTINRVYRVDIYSSAGSYKATLPKATETWDSPNSGWELHGGVLYFPPSYFYQSGDTLRLYGYGPYIVMSATSDTTDVDAPGIWAVRVFCQAEGFGRLLADRAAFQQWQTTSGNTDVTAAALAQLAVTMQRRWDSEKARLRRMRKG